MNEEKEKKERKVNARVDFVIVLCCLFLFFVEFIVFCFLFWFVMCRCCFVRY